MYIVVAVVFFIAGYVAGTVKQFDTDVEILLKRTRGLHFELNRRNEKIRELEGSCIDGEALIEWIRLNEYNYEYIAPPTTAEIIAKIKEMEGQRNEVSNRQRRRQDRAVHLP